MLRSVNKGVLFALLSAVLSAVPTPYCKYLLDATDPLVLIVVLNFSIGLGLGAMGVLFPAINPQGSYEPFVMRRDGKWLLMSALVGGVVSSTLLMQGLQRIPSSATSLLSSFEGMFAALIAWFLFKEPFDIWTAKGSFFITCGSLILFSDGLATASTTFSLGGLLVLASFFLMAVDTNLTHKLSHLSPFRIIPLRCSLAGTINLMILLLWMKTPQFEWGSLLLAGVIGFLGWGFGYYLFFLALRQLGAARTAGFISVSPFIGITLAIVFLRESLTLAFIAALLFIALGTYCLVHSKSESQTLPSSVDK